MRQITTASIVAVAFGSDRGGECRGPGRDSRDSAVAHAGGGSGKGAACQGAISVSPDVWLYQPSDRGLALELTAKGTRYYKNDDLN